MKSILIVGLGRFGRHAAQKLNELHHEVMAVDINEDRVEKALPYVTRALVGDGTDRDFLSSMGIRNFDLCIVAIGDNFQSSLETTYLLKDLGAQFVVSRAARDRHARFLLRNGADRIIYPERQMANWTAIRYSTDHVFDFMELDMEYSIYEISAPECWLGKTIGQLDVRKKYKVSILGMKVDGHLDPDISPDTVINGDEAMLVLARNSDIQKLFHA